VSGEHWPDIELGDRRGDRGGVVTALGELGERPADRSGLRLATRAEVAASSAVDLLGGVDQQKEQGEGAADPTGDVDRHVADLGEQFLKARGAGLVAAAGAAASAEVFDGGEHRVALEAADDLSEG
jgi:hypothetical protein